MSNIFSLPPQAQGNELQQITALRDYLVRLSRQLGSIEDGTVAVVQQELKGYAAKSSKETENRVNIVRQQAQTLRDLIIKTADDISLVEDRIDTKLERDYVANSEFGSYQQSVSAIIEQTALNTTAVYEYAETVEDGLNRFITKMNSQIAQGYITVEGTQYFGIAISNELHFTGVTATQGGKEYSQLDSGSNVGLYTAEGWYFFSGGRMVGWFSSNDGMLHVPSIVVEDSVRMGDWQISTGAKFGIKFVG